MVHRALAERDQPATGARPIWARWPPWRNIISTTERDAAEAEIDSVKMKKLEFFQRQLDARDPQIFRAIVLDVRNYGLLIELPDVLLTGLVHISSLTDDFYTFEQARQRRLIGRQSRRQFSVGDQLRVFVARVDTFKRQVDFALAEEAAAQNDAIQNQPGPKRTPRARKRFRQTNLAYRLVRQIYAEFCFPFRWKCPYSAPTIGKMDNILEAKERSDRTEAFPC